MTREMDSMRVFFFFFDDVEMDNEEGSYLFCVPFLRMLSSARSIDRLGWSCFRRVGRKFPAGERGSLAIGSDGSKLRAAKQTTMLDRWRHTYSVVLQGSVTQAPKVNILAGSLFSFYIHLLSHPPFIHLIPFSHL